MACSLAEALRQSWSRTSTSYCWIATCCIIASCIFAEEDLKNAILRMASSSLRVAHAVRTTAASEGHSHNTRAVTLNWYEQSTLLQPDSDPRYTSGAFV